MGTHGQPAKGYCGPMKKLFACFVIALASLNANAQARAFNQAELDALLAPVALYPDSLLDQILVAATYPHQVAAAAQWSQSNPRLSGDEAVRAAQPLGWHPSVTALTAFPDVLARMGASPQWVRELGEAWLTHEPYVLETVQQLRLRAEASGHLRSDEQQRVYRQGGSIVVQPVYSEVVFVRYYNPLVVFGPWWWPAYRPVYWHPWHARPVRYHWVNHPRPHYQRAAPVNVKPVNTRPHPSPAPRQHVRSSSNGSPSPAARMQAEHTARFIERQRAVSSAPQVRQMPAPTRYSQPRPMAQPQHRPRQAQQQRRDRRG